MGFHNSHKNCRLYLTHLSTTQIFVNLANTEFISMEALCRHHKDLKKIKLRCFSMFCLKLIIKIQYLYGCSYLGGNCL